MVAPHLERVHASDAVIGVPALAPLHFPALQFVHKIRIPNQRPGHLQGVEARRQHFLHARTRDHAAHVDEGQRHRRAEGLGIVQKIGVLIRDGGNHQAAEPTHQRLEPPKLTPVHIMRQGA